MATKATARKVAAAESSKASAKATDATYVYCVVRGAPQRAVVNPAGRVRDRDWAQNRDRDPGQEGETLPGAGTPRLLALSANTSLIVANVPLKTFGEDALRKRMRDVDWISRCGVAHQAVIDSFLSAADAVVPMTLFTIFANDARALAEARKDMARLEARLDRVAGRAEWVVRVLRGDAAASGDATAAPAIAATSATAAGATPRSGREFLQAKVDQRQAARRATEETAQAVRALMTGLSDVAEDVSDRTEAMTTGTLRSAAVLDAAFLLSRAAEPRFEDAARRFAQPLLDRGFKVSVTGPWPCYSFVSSRPSS